MIFRNRIEAGQKLASLLSGGPGALVLAIPRGGVIVAREVARALGAPLDVIVPRKLGAPHNPELGIGAVGPDGATVLDERLVRALGVTEEYVTAEVERQLEEIRRREKAYRAERPPLEVAGRTCIVVDDGIATGGTARAAVRSLKNMGAARVVLAVPVAPAESVPVLREDADEVVVAETPEPFRAVGQWYVHFEQVTDQEVIAALANLHRLAGE